VSTDVSEEHIASIFSVKEISSGKNQQASRHGVVSQKMVLFMTTAVRTSNPTFRGLLTCKKLIVTVHVNPHWKLHTANIFILVTVNIL
jgi:hypothetical protein